MSRLVRMPATVSQADAETVLALETQIYHLRQIQKAKCEEIVSRMMDGSTIEPGPHRIELRQRSAGARLTFRLAIDGRLMCMLLLLACASAGLAADDPGGWTTAKWGMSPDQVRAAVPAAVEIPPEKFTAGRSATIGVPALQLGPTTWSVFFLFDFASGLDRVMLRPASRTGATAAEYLRIEQLLTQRFGRPMERTIYKEGIRSGQWIFPATNIVLTLTDYRPTVQLVTLWLEYSRKSPDADKL